MSRGSQASLSSLPRQVQDEASTAPGSPRSQTPESPRPLVLRATENDLARSRDSLDKSVLPRQRSRERVGTRRKSHESVPKRRRSESSAGSLLPSGASQDSLLTRQHSAPLPARPSQENVVANSEDASRRPSLMDLNLKIKRGELVGVCGAVGSGKSTLLLGILGQLDVRLEAAMNFESTNFLLLSHVRSLQTGGIVEAEPSVAYVAQQAWIQNMTLRDNILFGEPYYPERYEVGRYERSSVHL